MSAKIVSMVCTASIGQVDLDDLASRLKCIYEPEQHPALFFRTKNPLICFALFSSGRIVSWGGTSLDAVERAFEQLLLGSNLSQDREKLKSPEIRMVVGTLDLRQSIDLKKTSKIIKKSRYRPHVFPGLLWKNNSQIALIFSSGKIVITGSKSKEELDKMAEELVRLFQ